MPIVNNWKLRLRLWAVFTTDKVFREEDFHKRKGRAWKARPTRYKLQATG